jgi:hypothetical protein
MVEIFVVTLNDLKRGCVHSCGMTHCNVSRRAVTSFEYRVAVENICCSTDVMIEIFVVTLHYLKHGCVLYIRAA